MNKPVRKIEVVPYNPDWEKLFNIEASSIREVLTEGLVLVHHIGSTSVKDLSAKPIIDIMLEVEDLQLLDSYNDAMTHLGYIVKGEYGIKGRRFYLKGLIGRTHHVHAFEKGSSGLNRHLALRDYLREHKEEASKYEQLKLKLAKQFCFDNDGYCEGKDAFVKTLEKKAVNWKAQLDSL